MLPTRQSFAVSRTTKASSSPAKMPCRHMHHVDSISSSDVGQSSVSCGDWAMPMRHVLDAVKLVARMVMSGPKKDLTSSHSSETATRGAEPARADARSRDENRLAARRTTSSHHRGQTCGRAGLACVRLASTAEGCTCAGRRTRGLRRDTSHAEGQLLFERVCASEERTFFRRLWSSRVVARVRRLARPDLDRRVVEELLEGGGGRRRLVEVPERVAHPPAPPCVQDVGVDECARWRRRR